MKYAVSYTRLLHSEIEAADDADAKAQADSVIAQIGADSITLLSIIAADYVNRPCPACALPREAVPKLNVRLLPHTGPGAA